MLQQKVKPHKNCIGGQRWTWVTTCCGVFAFHAKHSPITGPWYCSNAGCGQQVDIANPSQVKLLCGTCNEVAEHSCLVSYEAFQHDCVACSLGGKVNVPEPAGNWEIHYLDPNDPPNESETSCTECGQRYELVPATEEQ